MFLFRQVVREGLLEITIYDNFYTICTEYQLLEALIRDCYSGFQFLDDGFELLCSLS